MITERQRKMIADYDAQAALGNKAAGAIAMALRLKVARACETCRGWGSQGGENTARACQPCLAEGIINDDGNIVGSDKNAVAFARKKTVITHPSPTMSVIRIDIGLPPRDVE